MKKMNKKKGHACRQAGFTLIELIVSIGILAILSTLIMTIINPFEQYQKAADAKRKSDLSQLQKALEAYYQDTGNYPQSTGATGNQSTRYRILTTDAQDPMKDWGESWSPYMEIIPKDTGIRSYLYVTDGSSAPQAYRLYASLERGSKDPQSCNQLGNVKIDNETCTNVPILTACNSGAALCNYGVSSPNVSP